ncbi:hypothetical protein ACFFUA_37895, partial [Streptomyces heliomycini]
GIGLGHAAWAPWIRFWQARVDEQSRSRLFQQAFCRQSGIPVSSFNLWKWRLAGEAPMLYLMADDSAHFAPVSLTEEDAGVTSEAYSQCFNGVS